MTIKTTFSQSTWCFTVTCYFSHKQHYGVKGRWHNAYKANPSFVMYNDYRK